MKPIFITGFMGAGKTSVGKALGRRLALAVFDTDELIVRALSKTISEIFEHEGEEAFRQYETNALKKVTAEDVIVTTGGGLVMKEENRKWMKAKGMVIYLHCHIEEICRRLENDNSRPLIQNKNPKELAALLEKRLSKYQDADMTVDTTGKSLDQIVESIADRLINDGSRWL